MLYPAELRARRGNSNKPSAGAKRWSSRRDGAGGQCFLQRGDICRPQGHPSDEGVYTKQEIDKRLGALLNYLNEFGFIRNDPAAQTGLQEHKNTS
jgi:hypothetical protein